MTLLFNSRLRALWAFTALAGLLGYWVAATEGLINVYRIILPGDTLPDGSYPYSSGFWEVNAGFSAASLLLLALSLVALFLTREQDEYFHKLRLESIQFAVYAQFVAGMLAFAYFYLSPGYQMGNTFQAISGIACGTFLTAYAGHYYARVYTKTEQD